MRHAQDDGIQLTSLVGLRNGFFHFGRKSHHAALVMGQSHP